MAKTFREWNVEQAWLLPPSVLDFVPADHLAELRVAAQRAGLALDVFGVGRPGESGPALRLAKSRGAQPHRRGRGRATPRVPGSPQLQAAVQE